ncbi:right-handed parallel beta-helix repeat-containing protein [Halovulum sp. GXIMD14794]
MATYTVSSKSELQSALSSASGGDTIRLESGSYGDLRITQDFASNVTIVSDDPQGARFDTVEFSGASNITLDGVRVGGTSTAGRYVEVVDGSHHITIKNSEIGGPSGSYNGFGIYASLSSDLVYENNYIHHVTNGIANFQNSDIVLKGNVIDHIGGDSFKFGGIDGGLIENNTGAAHINAPAGAHNDFMQFQGTPSNDIVIRGNILLPANEATTQGIFFNTSGSSDNILIEQNIILAALLRGISLEDPTNVTIRYNTVLDLPGVAGDPTKILTNDSATVEHNIWTSYAGGTEGTNVVVQHDNANDTNYLYDLFKDYQGVGTTLEGLMPVDGSSVDEKGAYARLIELLTGEAPSVPTGSDPVEPETETPTTSPAPETDDSGTNGGDAPEIWTPEASDNTSTSGKTVTVSSASELKAVLKAANGGETILLEAGDYGDLTITKDYASEVTLKSASPLKAELGFVDIVGATNVTLDGLKIAPSGSLGERTHFVDILDGSKNITIKNSEIAGPSGNYNGFGIYASESSNLVYQNNYVHHVTNGIANFQNSDIVLKGNVVDHIGHDSYKFGGVDGGLIENNTGAAHVRALDGAHVDFMQFQGKASNDIVIRGNVLLPAEGDDATNQGIFFNTDSPSQNVLIEQNIVLSALLRGISIEDGKNVTIRDNTVLDIPGQATDATQIIAGAGAVVENNIWTEQSGGTEGSNVIVQHDDAGDKNYIYDLFTDFHGTGTTLEGLIPVEDSVVDGKGAYARLVELLTGESSDTPDTSAPETPDATPDTPETPDSDWVSGDDGDDRLYGDGNANNISGGDGDDVLSGYAGNDTLKGGAGDDRIKAHGGNDTLNGNSGADRLNGGRGDDKISGGTGNDRLNGRTGDDVLNGGEGDDVLRGTRGNDTLDGGDGNDIVDGGRGDDVMTGGAGSDTFKFRLSPGNDVITDFETGTDLIDLTRFDIDSGDFGDILASALSSAGGDASFDMSVLGTEGSIRFKGIEVSDLDQNDFVL